MKWRWIAVAAAMVGAAYAAADDPRDAVEQRIAPVLADPPASGLLIFEVLPGSQSDKAGFLPGDILFEYDGQPVARLSALEQLARAASKEGRGGLAVAVRRGEQELVAEFDAAPLGVRLIPVKEHEPRVLWRPATGYEPDLAPLDRLLSEAHRWELLVHEERVIGWAHSYLARPGDRGLFLRVQSRWHDAERGMSDKAEVVVAFERNRYLTPTWLRLSRQEKPILEFDRTGGKLRGERAGVFVEADAPRDVVSSHLAGLVATTMPRRAAECLRCSLLDAASLAAAPFADVYCIGEEELAVPGRTAKAYRFDVSAFGERVASYWIDREGRLLASEHQGGIRAVLAERTAVFERFPDAPEQFRPIEDLPQPRSFPPVAN